MRKREQLLIWGMLLACNGFAQEWKINHPEVTQKEDTLTISFSAEVDKLSSNYLLTLIPVLYGDTLQKELTPIVVMGRQKRISEKRTGKALNKTVKGTPRQSIPYQVTLPFEKWMYGVSLRIDSRVEGCCNEQIRPSQLVLSNQVLRPERIPVYTANPIAAPVSELERLEKELPFLYRMADYEAAKGDFDVLRERGALIVYFRQGASVIDTLYRENAKSLTQVKRVLDLIESDPDATLGKIVVAGGASPEGTLKQNEKMAQKRATVLRDYLSPDVSLDVFHIINLGEDWTGLRKKVEASSMPDKALVLEMIDNCPVEKGLEAKLMQLHRGDPYRYMFKELFPDLRSAGYIQIFYESKPDSEWLTTNKAIVLINKKEYATALELLNTLHSTAHTDNLIGVCYMMLEEEEQAISFFRKAVEGGNSDALKNLQQLSN